MRRLAGTAVGHIQDVRSDLEPPFGGDGDGDLLEGGDELSRLVVGLVVLVVALVAGVPRVLDWREERRERAAVVAAEKERRRLEAEWVAAERAAAADLVMLDVVGLTPVVRPAPPVGRPDEDIADIELTFTVRNRAGTVQVHDVRFTASGLRAVSVSHPDVIVGRGSVDLVASVRVPCASVLDLDDSAAATLSVTATPESGRQQTIDSLLRNHPLPLSSDLRSSCGLQSPWEAAVLVSVFMPSEPGRLSFAVHIRNISRQPLVVEQISSPGMSVTSPTSLPFVVPPGSDDALLVTVRVARCDALDIPVNGLTDDFDPLLRLAVTGVKGEPAQLVANISDRPPQYHEAKHRLLAKECPLQVRGEE